MSALDIGQAMVAMVSQGRQGEEDFVSQYYSDNIVSIEGQDSEDMPGRLVGIDAVRGKHDWWYANNEIHSTTLEGPFVGHRDDQFVMRFILDATPKGEQRMQMTEVGLFTVAEGKIVQEEYLYLMG